MTLLYRERLRTRRPPEMVAVAVARSLGSGDERGERSPDAPGTGERRWTDRRGFGLYRHEVRLDPVDGAVVRSVHGPGWFAVLSAVALVAGLAVALAHAVGLAVPAPALLATLWIATGLALVPVAHLWPGTPATGPELDDVAETVGRRLAPVAVPPYLAVVLVCWTALRAAGTGSVAHGTGVVLLLVGGGVYYAANSLSSGTDDGGVPSVALALTALSPTLVAAANLVVAGGLVGGDPPETVDVALAVAFCLALDAVFFLYCRVALRTFDAARFVHVRSRARRGAGIAALAVVNGVLLAAVATGGSFLAVEALGGEVPIEGAGQFYPEFGAIAGVFWWSPPGGALVAAAAVYGLVATPVLVVVAGWVRHLASATWLRWVVLRRSTPMDPPADLDVAVRVVDLGVPVVRPVTVGSRGFVVVDRSVTSVLDEAELAAVLAHESHHLAHRGPATSLLAGAASLLVGGPNVLVAFYDYPALERAADDRAVRLVGADALVGALRRLERARYERGLGRDRRPSVMGAPVRLFFGPVLLDRAHGDVDERIARVTGSGDGADARGC